MPITGLRLVARSAVLSVAVVMLGLLGQAFATNPPIMRNLELEALAAAARWPNAAPQTILALAGQFMASRRDQDGHAYFRERAQAEPSQPLFVALEGFFQARVAPRVSLLQRSGWVGEAIAKLDTAVNRAPGLTRYFRGVVFAQLPPSFGKADVALSDLEWVLQNKERFPRGLLRNVYRGLAQAYTTLGRTAEAKAALDRSGYPSLDPGTPLFTTDVAVSAKDGVRQSPPRLIEMAPKVYVAQGFDFADIVFVETTAGVVVIDAGSSPTTAGAALSAFRKVSSQPISDIVLTHAHWDHVGGLAALKGPATRVIAQAKFAEELQVVNETNVGFRYFAAALFGPEGRRRLDVVPDHLVGQRETLTVGDTEIVLYPTRSGETDDALVIHLPAKGVVFVGDAFMPWLGAPFVAEGSPEGFFATLALVRSLGPRLVIHGHAPLTQNFTIAALAGLDVGLREVYERARQGIRDGKTLAAILDEVPLPPALRDHPASVVTFVVTRENFIKRVYHQRSGYWKPDGEGMEVVGAPGWAMTLDLLGGNREEAFVRAARTLVEQGDDALGQKVADLGLLRYPASRPLAELRRRALDGLRDRFQQLNPFKFYIYSELAGAELSIVE